MRSFDFSQLVARFGQQTAVVEAQTAYSYHMLDEQAQTIKRQNTFSTRYVVLVAQQNVTFISQFLAVHLAGRIPIVVNEQDVARVPQLLTAIAGEWQWVSEHRTTLSQVGPMNPQGMLFLGTTSGTTGQPKVYQRDWQSWQLGFEQCRVAFDMVRESGVMTTSPLGTSLGLHTLLMSLYLGKTFYCFQRKQKVQLMQPTMVYTVPTYLTANYCAWAENSQIHSVVSCGGELTPELVQSWQVQHPDQRVYELYGTSETSLVAWQPLHKGKQRQHVGQLFTDVNVSIMPDSHRLAIRSPYLFSGYLGEPNKVDQVTTDDIGYFDGASLVILSRVSDIMNHGGNKIYPSEIEQALHPITDDCVVFGVPDTVYGEKIVAMLVTNTPITTLAATLRTQLPAYKMPSEYIVVSEIPKTAQAKVSRAQLTAAYQAGKWS